MNLKTDNQKIRNEVNLPVSLEKAWEFLTERDYISNWCGNHVTPKARPGGAFLEKWLTGRNE